MVCCNFGMSNRGNTHQSNEFDGGGEVNASFFGASPLLDKLRQTANTCESSYKMT
jgi:hypothetical protein